MLADTMTQQQKNEEEDDDTRSIFFNVSSNLHMRGLGIAVIRGSERNRLSIHEL